jgi:hypothetical protein
MPETSSAAVKPSLSEMITKAPDSKPTYKIASIPGDGIGIEVVHETLKVLEALTAKLGSFDLDVTEFDWNSETYKKTGKYTPDDYLDTLKKFDAILFGAVGDPGIKFFHTMYIKRGSVEGFCYHRCSRSHLPLGPPASNVSTPTAIRQRPSHTHSPWHAIPTQPLRIW